MAAIDPSAEPEFEDDAAAGKPSRSTLKIVRMPGDLDSDDEVDEDWVGDSEDDSEDDEEVNGGPSDKAKAKKRQEAAALMELDEDEDDEDGTDSAGFKAALSQLIKGKAPATGDEDEDDDDEEGLELEEVVVCTLDTERVKFLPI